jgi:hypothetical protein
MSTFDNLRLLKHQKSGIGHSMGSMQRNHPGGEKQLPSRASNPPIPRAKLVVLRIRYSVHNI